MGFPSECLGSGSGIMAMKGFISVSPSSIPMFPNLEDQLGLPPNTRPLLCAWSCPMSSVRLILEAAPFSAEPPIEQLAPSNCILLVDKRRDTCRI